MHGPTDISPVGMAAAMHLGLAIHNFGIQEYMQPRRADRPVFRQSFTFTDGMLHPGDQPGLGVSLDVDEARQHIPYQTAYLPYNRLLADGTVHALGRACEPARLGRVVEPSAPRVDCRTEP